MLKIDIHTHILPQYIPNFKSKFGYGGFLKIEPTKYDCANLIYDDGKFFRKINKNCWDINTRLKECKTTKVDIQVISTVPSFFNYWAKPSDTLTVSKYLNDHIANVVEKNPSKFIGLGTVPLQDPELAINEMTRCMKDLNLVGIEIGSHINKWNLNEPF